MHARLEICVFRGSLNHSCESPVLAGNSLTRFAINPYPYLTHIIQTISMIRISKYGYYDFRILYLNKQCQVSFKQTNAMRHMFTIGFLLFIFLNPQGQNAYFRPLGSSKDEVQKYLISNNYLIINQESDSGFAVSGDHFTVNYEFQEGYLYRVVMDRKFDEKSEAEQMVESFRNYFTLRKASIHDDPSENKTAGTFHAKIGDDDNTVMYDTEKGNIFVSFETKNELAAGMAKYRLSMSK